MSKKINRKSHKVFYKAGFTPASWDDVQREFLEVERSMSQMSELLATEAISEEPAKPFHLQMRYADGVNWDPRGAGAGLYIFINGEWKKVTLT